MNELLNIITVSARPENISLIGKNILSQKKEWKGKLYWNIIFDFDNEIVLSEELKTFLYSNNEWIKFEFLKHPCNKSSGGNHGKDILIKRISQGWIYQLDDDNELYPNFLKNVQNLITENPNKNIFCFWQHGRYKPNLKKDLKAGITDTAMYIFNKSACENIDYPLYYGGDGVFLEKIIEKNNESFHIEKKVLCWYNKLKYLEFKDMDNELSKLAVKFNTDKYSRHKYTKIYSLLFEKFKNKNIKLLELGILEGNSLRMWREWFSKAEIFGVDNKIQTENIENVTIIKSNTQTIHICKDLNYEKFDIIIDDADHHPYQQLITLWNTWPLLKDGGIYIIEDIQNLQHWKKHWDFLKPEIYDLRNDGGTYDSVLFVLKK